MSERHSYRKAEEVALAIAFAAVLVGIGVTDFTPVYSHYYWFGLTIVVAALGTFMGSLSLRKDRHKLKKGSNFVWAQLVHWAAVLAAISCVYILLNAGRLNYASAGLVTGLILGLATFLDGFHRVGWRFAVLGIVIVAAVLIAALIEEFVLPLLLFIIFMWVITFLWERHRLKRQMSKTQ